MRFEYKILYNPEVNELNHYGKDGWEIVGVVREEAQTAVYLMRRV